MDNFKSPGSVCGTYALIPLVLFIEDQLSAVPMSGINSVCKSLVLCKIVGFICYLSLIPLSLFFLLCPLLCVSLALFLNLSVIQLMCAIYFISLRHSFCE